MADEILRLRTIVVPDNSGLRQVQQNLQQLQKGGSSVFQTLVSGAEAFAQSIKKVHSDTVAAGTAINRTFGLIGVAMSTGAVVRRVQDLSREIVGLSYSARELGLSERYVRAFMNVAERRGVPAEAMKQGLANLRQALEGLNYAGSELRNTLIEMGGRDLARELAAIPDQGQRTIVFFQRLNEMMEKGPMGRRRAEETAKAAGVPFEALRVLIPEVEREAARLVDRTNEETKAAGKLIETTQALGKSFDGFLIRALPGITSLIDLTNSLIDRITAFVKILDEAKEKQRGVYEGREPHPLTGEKVPQGFGGFQRHMGEPTDIEKWGNERGLIPRMKQWWQGIQPQSGGGPLTGGMGIINALVGGGGMPNLRGAAGEDRLQDEETTEEGTFKALVRFDSYLKMGKNLGGAGGPGVGGAGGTGGLGGAGGGEGGAQPGGVGQGSGQQDQSTTKSDATQAPGFGQGIPGFTPGPGGTKVPSFGGTFGSMKDFAQVPTRSVGGASGQGDPSEVMPGDSPARQANVRTNNPGAQYPSDVARRFGMSGQSVIGGGHKIAHFPTPVHGAAANFATLSGKNYIGKTIAQAMRTWSGGSRSIPGPDGKPYDPNTIITADMVRDPNFAIPFMKAVTSGEGRGKYPMSDAQWGQAHNWFMAGSPQGDALKRTENLPGAPEGTRQAYRPQLPGEGGGGGGAVGAPYAGVKSMADLRIGSGNRYGASRSGGGRAHSGNDLHAPGGDGSAVLSMTGGTVLYNGNNAGYGANIVIKGDDGVIRRYATHAGTENLRPGARVEQGQRIGIQGKGHTHYEEIPPTIGGRPNPVYGEFERNARTNTFTSTSHQRGTVDPSGAQGTLAQIGKTPPTSVAGAPSGAIVEGAPPGAGASNAERLMQRRASMLSQNTRRSEMPGGFIKDDTRAEGALDRANGAQTSFPQSSINLDVRHDGSRASARVAESKGPAFADTKIKNQTQMQPTADYGKTAEP